MNGSVVFPVVVACHYSSLSARGSVKKKIPGQQSEFDAEIWDLELQLLN